MVEQATQQSKDSDADDDGLSDDEEKAAAEVTQQDLK